MLTQTFEIDARRPMKTVGAHECDFIYGHVDHVVLEDAPITPSWVKAGAPMARAGLLSRARDGGATTTVWDCTAGCFDWYFGWDETVHILEGEVVVTDAKGFTRTIRAGDVAFFPAGTWATWNVPRYVRKLAYCRQAVPKPITLSLRIAQKLKRLLARFSRGAAAAPAAGVLGA